MTDARPGADGAAQTAAHPAIRFQNIGLVYGRGTANEVEALKDVSFDVRPQEFVSILGPSGCGKSTLLRLVAGFLNPTSGSVSVGGVDPENARTNGLLGVVFQSPVLLQWRNVIENVGFLLELQGVPRRKRQETARHYIDLVGLGGFERHMPHQLSGGMQQRVSIARALAFGPSVLLMDEPFGALDALTRDRMAFDLLDIWKRDKKTVLFVTHSVQEAVFLSDVVIVMTARPGKVGLIRPIDLGRPRTKDHRLQMEFVEHCRVLLDELEADVGYH
ncbi:ABC transporter ATP-binding protein [Acuticoccus sp. M5D2P5]|uniref:ABC transporter ATP-binding protein n=1 Tax=Acuticoccus kalidii TaxID=2910977 RepID=UPI001F31809B|nr:ABC transporter ATP-binding protein [Acuticoccus kalidii]MCF3934939.1 ABC transporter ATP-binding protein [Acuticoccus kalidii]